MFPEITHHAPVILVAEDRIVHHSQGEDRVIAGEAEGGAVGQVLQGEPKERSIRHGRRVLEHPPRGILPEPETQAGTEGQFSGVQVREIAGVRVRPSRGPLEKPVRRQGDRHFPPLQRGADGGQLLQDDQASRFCPANRENREPCGAIAEQNGRMKRPSIIRQQVQLRAAVNRQQAAGIQGRLLQGRALVLDRVQFAIAFDDGLVRRERRDRAIFQGPGIEPKCLQHDDAQNHRGERRCEVGGSLQGLIPTIHCRLSQPFSGFLGAWTIVRGCPAPTPSC